MEIPGAGFLRKPSGAIVIDGQERAHTVQCVHCGCHWLYIPGSKRVRGYCTRCQAMTCGAPDCNACVPVEKRLEHMERTG